MKIKQQKFSFSWVLIKALIFIVLTLHAAKAETLRMGVLAMDAPVATLKKYKPLSEYLSIKLERSVDLVPQPSWNSMILALTSSRLDYVIMSTGAYVSAINLCSCVEAIAIAQSISGTTGYHGIMLTLASKDIDTLAKMNARRMTIIGEKTTASHLVPVKTLKAQGFDPEKSFKDIFFKESIHEGVDDLLKGKTDALLTWSWLNASQKRGFGDGALALLKEDVKEEFFPDLKLIWSSPEIPNPPHVVRINLADPIKNRLKDALLELPKEKPELFEIIADHNAASLIVPSQALFMPLMPAFAKE